MSGRPALVVSVVALLIALGGTGYAALTVPDLSVGTRQLKDHAVIARKVRAHSLLALDFKPGQLPRGPAGADGKPGAAGAPGTARAYGVVSAGGVLGATRSKGLAAVTHPAVGIYCIQLATGIDSAATTLVASPDESDPATTGRSVAHVKSGGGDCPAGSLEVVMRHIDITTTPSLAITDHHTDNGFTFMVP
jgi:hypothetical protein